MNGKVEKVLSRVTKMMTRHADGSKHIAGLMLDDDTLITSEMYALWLGNEVSHHGRDLEEILNMLSEIVNDCTNSD